MESEEKNFDYYGWYCTFMPAHIAVLTIVRISVSRPGGLLIVVSKELLASSKYLSENKLN